MQEAVVTTGNRKMCEARVKSTQQYAKTRSLQAGTLPVVQPVPVVLKHRRQNLSTDNIEVGKDNNNSGIIYAKCFNSNSVHCELTYS